MGSIDIIIDKMIKMEQYIKELGTLKPNSFSEYISDMRTQYAIERVIQLIIDLALDINNIILSFMDRPPASDYFNSFIDVAECGVIDMDFAVGIAPSSGLRNRLVHEYEKINDEIVYSSIDQVIKMYTEYMVYIKGNFID